MLKKVSYKDQIYQYLKEAIVKGELLPGEVYSEKQFADKLNVSRTPVREAVLQLKNDDLIEIFNNRGFGVKATSPDDLRQILQARLAIEGYAVLCLANHPHDKRWQETVTALMECQKTEAGYSEDDESHYEFMKADIKFHHLIVDFPQNAYLSRMANLMRTKIELATVHSLRSTHRHGKAYEEHQQILDAILTGDSDRAASAFRKHMEETVIVLGAKGSL